MVVEACVAHERRHEHFAVALLLPLRFEVSRIRLLVTRSVKVPFRVVKVERRTADMPNVVVDIAVPLLLLFLASFPFCFEISFAGAALADARSLRGSIAEVVAIADVCKEVGGHKANDVSSDVAIAVRGGTSSLGNIGRHMARGISHGRRFDPEEVVGADFPEPSEKINFV